MDTTRPPFVIPNDTKETSTIQLDLMGSVITDPPAVAEWLKRCFGRERELWISGANDDFSYARKRFRAAGGLGGWRKVAELLFLV